MRASHVLTNAAILAAAILAANIGDGRILAADKPAPKSANAITSDPDEQLSRQLLELKSRRAQLAANASATDPDLAELDAQIMDLRQQLAQRDHQLSGDNPTEDSAPRAPATFPRIVAPSENVNTSPAPEDVDQNRLASQANDTDLDFAAPANLLTRAALRKTVSIQENAQPLSAVLDELARQSATNFLPTWRTLQSAGIDKDTPITIHLTQIPAARAIRAVLDQIQGDTAHLGYTVDAGVVIVSTDDDLSSAKYQDVRVFDVRDLLALQAGDYPLQFIRTAYTDRVDNLLDTIKSVVAPDTWRDNGGTVGSIRELSGQLIVSQTADNQAAVAQLLEKLRSR